MYFIYSWKGIFSSPTVPQLVSIKSVNIQLFKTVNNSELVRRSLTTFLPWIQGSGQGAASLISPSNSGREKKSHQPYSCWKHKQQTSQLPLPCSEMFSLGRSISPRVHLSLALLCCSGASPGASPGPACDNQSYPGRADKRMLIQCSSWLSVL